MTYSVDLSRLLQAAAAVPGEPDDHYNPLAKESEGVQYLYRHVLLPLMQEIPVSSADLDMGRFDFHDIEQLYTFFLNRYCCRAADQKTLRRFYETFVNAPPQCTGAAFL